MPVKAVLFDIDGTLVDSNDLHVAAWDQVFRDAGHHFDRETLHSQIGKGGDNYVPALLPEASGAEQERLKDAHRKLFTSRYIDRTSAFRGARDLLAKVRDSGRKVVLATSASGEELDKHLQTIGAEELIDARTSKDDVSHSKPCPDIFEAALGKAAVAPSEALVVGDTPYDVEAASRCGVSTIAVRSGGFTDADLRYAVAIYDDVAALLADFDKSPICR